MSELNSLFAKITISKEQFGAFLDAAPAQPLLDENWAAWWDARSMYSKTPLTQTELRKYADSSNEKIIDRWKFAGESITSSEYDETTETWHLAIMFFSENYIEMLPMLAFLKSIAIYKKDNPGDFALVYDYFWGDDDVSAYITFEKGTAALHQQVQNKTDVPVEILEYSTTFLLKKWEEYEKNSPTD